MADEPVYDWPVIRGDCLAIAARYKPAGEAIVGLDVGWTADFTLRDQNDEVILEFVDADNRITLDSDGWTRLTLTGDETEAIPNGSYPYHLRLISADNCTTTILKGLVKVGYGAKFADEVTS